MDNNVFLASMIAPDMQATEHIKQDSERVRLKYEELKGPIEIVTCQAKAISELLKLIIDPDEKKKMKIECDAWAKTKIEVFLQS